MTHEIALLSPEKVVLTLRLASLGSRILAHMLDLLLVGAALYVLMIALVFLTAARALDESLATALLGAVAGLGWLFYFTLFEAFWNGQTLGKKAAGIAVRMADGTPVTFLAALGRNVLRPADFFPAAYFLGLLAVFTNPKAQRIGDLVAGTVVLHIRKPVPVFRPAPHTIAEHPLEPFVGDLRGMTREEYVALRRFCDRYPELSPEAQSRFLEEVWTPIALRRGVPRAPNIHPLYLAEAVVMRYGRIHGLL